MQSLRNFHCRCPVARALLLKFNLIQKYIFQSYLIFPSHTNCSLKRIFHDKVQQAPAHEWRFALCVQFAIPVKELKSNKNAIKMPSTVIWCRWVLRIPCATIFCTTAPFSRSQFSLVDLSNKSFHLGFHLICQRIHYCKTHSACIEKNVFYQFYFVGVSVRFYSVLCVQSAMPCRIVIDPK